MSDDLRTESNGIKQYADDENHSCWKITLDYFLSEEGGKFILYCNFHTRKLPIYLPNLYKECLDTRAQLHKTVVTITGIGTCTRTLSEWH